MNAIVLDMVIMLVATNVMYVSVINAIVVKEYLELQLKKLGGKLSKDGLCNGDCQDELLFYRFINCIIYIISFFWRTNNMKKCKQCEKEFEPKDELDMFCGQECKEEALAELDSGSDECLSCQ
jgi:hypothetical protein